MIYINIACPYVLGIWPIVVEALCIMNVAVGVVAVEGLGVCWVRHVNSVQTWITVETLTVDVHENTYQNWKLQYVDVTGNC